jgi:cysteine-rich repeat protein
VLITRTSAAVVVAFAMAFPIPSEGRAAERLLAQAPVARDLAARPSHGGVARAARLTLGLHALAALRGERTAVVTGFPLGADRTVDLELHRFEVFTPGARVEVWGDGPVRRLGLPDNAYFAGTVRGEPASRVFLVAGRSAVHGLVTTESDLYRFGPDAAGVHRSYALRDVDPAVYPPGGLCALDLEPRFSETPGAAARAVAEAGLLPPPVAPTPITLHQADLAIETDRELRLAFPTDQATLDYIASLVAAGTAIYERDVSIRLNVSYVRLWSGVDPWSATSTTGALDEVQNYWLDPLNSMDAIAGSHDAVHFLSGKSVTGGVAYLSAICDHDYGFGVSQVYGGFDLADPTSVWDVIVFTHELGHNFGSPHTHCYSPPIDRCYNAEPGCYSGAVVASRGTLMSYCHLLAGVENIDLLFGATVSSQIYSTVAGVSCLATVLGGDCGNGIVEPGESCDDGNTVSGDGCSGGCWVEGCGNAIVELAEGCDDGNTVSGDGCSPDCVIEPRCGDGTVDPGEECDDGNMTSGDGCSAVCQREPCTVVKSAQTIWPLARVTVRNPGTARDQLLVRGDFGLPMSVDALTPNVAGARLLVENGGGVRKVDVVLPAGGAWSVRRGRWLYRDPSGAAGGIRRVLVRDMTRGGVPDVKIVLQARGGGYKLSSADLPLAVTVILGDDAAGSAGACGRYAFGGGNCSSPNRGTRLVCR